MEVDPITPKNKFGEDSINNYQALCYTCNSQKRDLDDTDFREIKHIYEMRDPSCVFCNIPNGRILFENTLAMAFHDNYPVTKGHLLIVPKRHAYEYFDLYQAEINAIHELLMKAKQELQFIDPSISGFNIGVIMERIRRVKMNLIAVYLLVRLSRNPSSKKQTIFYPSP